MECDEKINDCYEIISYVQIEEEKCGTQTVVPVTDVEYPIDKINKTIWNENNGIDFSKTIRIKTGNRKKKTDSAMIKVTIDFDAFSKTDDITTSETLTTFDKACLFTIASLYNAGNKIISGTQIYKKMNISSTQPNTKDLDEIWNSIKKMAQTRVTIDNRYETEVYQNYELVQWDVPLLAIEIITQSINGSVTEMGIKVLQEPALLSFAKLRKQFTTIPIPVWKLPVRKTKNRLVIHHYMLQEIAHIKKGSIRNRMLYETIFEQCGKLSATQQWREKKAITEMLEHYKSNGFITGYNSDEKGIDVFYKAGIA